MMMFSSGAKVEACRRINDDLAAGKALADVIVGIAFQFQGDPARDKRAKTLPGRAVEAQVDGIIRQAFRAVAAGHLAADLRADHAVDIANGQVDRDAFAPFEGRFAQIQQHLVVQRFFQAVILGDRAAAADCQPAPPAGRAVPKGRQCLAFQ